MKNAGKPRHALLESFVAWASRPRACGSSRECSGETPKPRTLARTVGCTVLACVIATVAFASEPATRAYISNERSGDLTVVDLSTNQPIATIPVGKRPRGVHISAD